MSFGQQSSSGTQEQGLSPYYKNWFSDQSTRQFGYLKNRARQAEADPGGLDYLSTVDRLLPIGKYGVPTSAEQGTYQLGRDLWTQAAGNRMRRGFSTPGGIEAVLGDAVRMASGSLIPLATQTALARAQMAPGLRAASFGYAKEPFEAIRNIIASSGTGSNRSSGFGFDLSAAGGPAGAAAVTSLLSDRRLKHNIVRIGTHKLGIGIYEYTLFGRREQGVMADEVLEVLPEAVSTGDDGFYRVNYALLG